MAYKPAINNHGKPYGSYPYGVSGASSVMQQFNKALESHSQTVTQSQLQAAGGLASLGQTAANGLISGSGMLGGISTISGVSGPTAVTTFPLSTNGTVVFTLGTIAGTTTVTINKNNKLPFTEDRIKKLKETQPRKVTKRVPDYIEPITAWRGWSIGTDNGGELRLRAVGVGYDWEPKKKTSAICIPNGVENKACDDHIAPKEWCTCGVWSFKTLDLLLAAISHYGNSVKAIGNVLLWGKIVETENGYRAQYAYPSELWLIGNEYEEIGHIYGVPVRIIESENSDNK